jgi:hypothetical protein
MNEVNVESGAALLEKGLYLLFSTNEVLSEYKSGLVAKLRRRRRHP